MKELSSKERALMAFAHQEPDRVPINYLSNPGIDRRLKAHYGLDAGDSEGLNQKLGVDFRRIDAPYIGPKLHADVPERQVDMWGIHRRWIEHESGGYWDYCDFPLKEAGLQLIESWPMPSPDDFDYGAVAQQCQQYKDYCCMAGNPGVGDIINSTGMIRTMEQVLVDLMLDDEVCLRYIDRKNAVQLEIMERTLTAGAGAIDLLWLGEDLGTQRGPMISPELFRRHLRPRHQHFVDLAKSHGIPVMLHSCGSSSWAFDDFIEMGVGIIDTLQPEVKDMAPAYLKERYGEKLAFHGCISTAGAVAYGTAAETAENVRQTLEIMMPGGGYALAPTHHLQDNSPTENVVALYETALHCGYYT